MKRSDGSWSSKGVSLVPKVLLMCFAFFYAGLQCSNLFRAGSEITMNTSQPPRLPVPEQTTSASTTPTFTPCQAALSYFTKESLEEAIQKALDFHVRGGNLKSVQVFKDRSIDGTLEKLAIQFIPDEKKETPTKDVTTYLRQYYDSNFDSRGGYGRALPGKFSQEDNKMLNEKRWFDVAEPFEGRQKWDAGIGPIGPACSLVQLGPTGKDGTKFVCQEMNASSVTTTAAFEHCDVLSVGGNDNWKFEQAVREEMKCVTHTFDCTLPSGKPRHKPKDDDINFFNNCIDGESHQDAHGRQYLSYHDMLEKANVTEAPKLFKLDVEGFEYDIFTQMIRNQKKSHLLPQQITVELHWATRMTGQSWMPRTRTSAEIALLIGMMFTAGGYLPVHTDFTPFCSSCLEVTFFRAVC